jgi:hypothetical protein
MVKFGEIKVTIDLDNTVIERYGKQEGSKRGYNPKKLGRLSQHPFVVFILELKLAVNGWLRHNQSTNKFFVFYCLKKYKLIPPTSFSVHKLQHHMQRRH